MQLPFRAISAFHAVAKTRSVSKAASELGVTPSAVSQQVHSLENELGSALMVKVGTRIKLTSAGERYFEMIGNSVDRVIEATGRMKGYRSASVLNIRATPSLATKWLLPRLPRFLDAYPHLDVRLNATNEPTDFSREEVDLDIRPGQGHWPGFYVEGFAEERFLPVCAPTYAPDASITFEELSERTLIHSVKSAIQWSDWFRSVGLEPRKHRQRLLLDRSHMSIDAAVSGFGIALESTLMMSGELASSALVCPVRDPPITNVVSQWIVVPPDHLSRQKVRLFVDWLRGERERWSVDQAKFFGPQGLTVASPAAAQVRSGRRPRSPNLAKTTAVSP
jgi:LysR family transcriptional regulator, glycine cleavage system transcriptional activator